MGTIPSFPNACSDDCHCPSCLVKRHDRELAEAFELAESQRPPECLFDGDDE